MNKRYKNLTLLSSLLLIWYKLFQEKLQYLSRDVLSRERVLSIIHANTFEEY